MSALLEVAGETLASAVYEGVVQHRRLVPHPHVFHYPMAQLYLDLDEIDQVFERHRCWSVERANLAQFRRGDYLGDPRVPLAEAVRRVVEQATGEWLTGPIRMLTHLRYFGYIFNPVTFYYCYAADGRALAAIVAEITNTPWKERHAYVLPIEDATRQGRALVWEFAKTFHVSPFMPMDCEYAWRFTTPGENLHVHMDVTRHGQREFDAHLRMIRRPLCKRTLARVLWRYPVMTLQVMGAIHWQAWRLWLKRTPVYDHPHLSRGSR